MRLENSFLLAPGIGQKSEQKLWKAGVTHWDEVEDSNALSTNRKNKILNFLEKARKNLEVGNTHFFADKLPNREIWRTYRNFEDDACFFDIETTGLSKNRNKVTTVSFYSNGESKTLIRGKDLTRERLEKELFDAKILVSFNGKMFDQPFLEHNFNLDIDTPHIDLMHSCRRINLTGGLKNIEKELGVERELEDLDGRQAIRLWKKYEKKGDEDALEKLVKYNQYDTENLKEISEIVVERLTSQFYRPYVDSP